VETYDVEVGTAWTSGVKSFHSPGIPLKTCVPRSVIGRAEAIRVGLCIPCGALVIPPEQGADAAPEP